MKLLMQYNLFLVKKLTNLRKGFIKRERKITGSGFIKTLIFGWMQNKSTSVEGLSRAGYTHELYISAQGLNKYFTKDSACALCFKN